MTLSLNTIAREPRQILKTSSRQVMSSSKSRFSSAFNDFLYSLRKTILGPDYSNLGDRSI